MKHQTNEIIGEGRCPNCGRKLKVPFPYNVDLSKETPYVICSGCGKHFPVRFTLSGELGKFGPIQFIFKKLGENESKSEGSKQGNR